MKRKQNRTPKERTDLARTLRTKPKPRPGRAPGVQAAEQPYGTWTPRAWVAPD